MEKLDLTKKYKTYFTAKIKPEIVEIEAAQFLSLTGKGDPSGEPFAKNIEALYSTAYTIKFVFKQLDKDFTVSKLEALWWFDQARFGAFSLSEAPQKIPRNEWEYRLLIRMPGYVTEQDVKNAIQTVVAKKQIELAKSVEFYTMTEGKCVQMLHVGPFSTEPETLEKMNVLIQQHGFQKNGEHHEIYLSDFRKTDPDKLKTILREPVK
ncbi:GyrI-like domain-containing protein [Gynurincola endophyticus]|uniref:GyrI-like domain-containing protein n=1 Tax=Gynurincola endophyticus TaxID=2479004 RepID=UPI000F8E4884|nr:GyrI-like domain-containing protein [Gynurincola endophyticus]